MKKCYSLFATLFAATALYAGDILEICPCDEFGYPVSEYDYTHDSPAPSGKKLYFNVRLVSRTQNNRVAAADRSHFNVVYSGTSAEVDAALNPLKIGIVVSGETRWASLVNPQPTPWRGSSSEKDCYNLYDLVFEYDTQPGDFALPIRLAQDDKGTPWTDGTNSGVGPTFRNQNKWTVTYTSQASEGRVVSDANLTMCDLPSYSGDINTWCDGLSDAEIEDVKKFWSITLYNAGFWVQTLDIPGRKDEAAWESPDYWKSVAKGHREASTVRSNGDAVVTNDTVVWVWAVDKGWLETVEASSTAAWVSPSVEMSGSNAEEIEITYDYDRKTSKPLKKKVLASRVEIPGGASKPIEGFTFKGVAEGDVYLVMSGSSNFLWKAASGYEFVKDSFVTVPVRCVPAEREVTLRRTESAETYMVTSNYETPLTTLELTLAEDYTEPVTVTVTPKLSKPGDPVKYAWTDYIRIADEASGYEQENPLTVTFKDGKAGAKTVYVFGRGAAGVDSGLWYDTKKGNRIEFEITVDPVAAAGGKITADNIYVKPADPVIVNAAALAAKDVRGGVALPIDINVSDNFTDMNDTTTGYEVWFRAPGATEEEVEKLKTKTGAAALWRPKGADGTLYAYDTATGTYTADRPAIPDDVTSGEAELWLVAPNTAQSAHVNMTLTVTPPSQVSARAYATEDGEVPAQQFREFDATTGDAAAAYFEIEISEKYDKAAAIYAFLKLADESKAKYISGDCVVGSDFSAGIPIYRGATTSDGRGTVYLKDGIKSGTTLRFSIVLCTSSEYDETKKVEGFTSNDVTIKVTNVAPVVNDIRMNGWRLNADKTAFKGSATVGIMQTFKFDVWDAELDLDGTGTEAMKIAYIFTDGNTTDAEKECTGNPSTWVIQRKFKTVGTDTCSIEYTITDKDGGKVTGSAYIPVSGNPYVSITGDETAFYENTYPQFTLALSETPDEDLTVRLTVTPQATGDKRGKLEIGEGTYITYVSEGVYDILFQAGVTPRRTFGVSDADGTAGGASKFDFTAKVITDTVKPGTADTRWCDFYEPGALGPITVQNVAPALVVNGRRFDDMSTDYNFNSSNAPIRVAVGPGDKILWNVDDVSADLAGGIKVTITDQKGSRSETVTTTDTREFTPEFKYAGPTTVTLTATDKDGASITVTIYYNVNSTRQLNITAVGPSENGKGSPHANHYRGAGRGQGHVWVDATCTGALAFSFEYNCGLANFVQATAQGYRVGDVDDGTLTKNGSGGDIAISPSGGKAAGQPYFTYDSEYDSFFYCWVKDVYDNGTMTSEIYGGVSPEVRSAGATQIALPTEKDAEEAYPLTTFEVIFSKEYLWSDNIGDINNDGIPDIYALGYKDFGVSAEDGTDMNSLRDYNADEDYFPFIFGDAQNSFVFMPVDNWASHQKKFTAFLEIRGWGEHLNNAYQVLSKQGYAGSIPAFAATNVYTNPAVDKNSTLTALEYDAWVQAGRDPEWSPERPTDPTKADTDGDNMPDGYEYYIWYKAHVGWMDGNTHKYLTGRKYNPSNPYDPIEITSETIAASFDPLANAGSDWDVRDTDDDGISDYGEYILGTNPFDYDTDGDGLPDGYEISISGTDPLKADTNENGIPDGAENPDNDSIAEISKDMLLVSVIGANGTEYYCCDGAGLNDYSNAVATAALKGTRFEIVTGGGATTNTLVTTRNLAASTYTNDANKVCLRSGFSAKNTWQCTKIGDAWVRTAEPVADQMKLGTVIENIVEDAEYHDQNLALAGETAVGTWYVAYPYAGGYARGGSASFAAISAKGVLSRSVTGVKLMHYQVFHEKGFHSSTGWIHPPSGGVDTRSFTTMDEFLSMVFFHKMGTLTEGDMAVTPQHSRIWIWQHYSTNPTSADTDGDQMPDGWEFYVMAENAADNAHKGPTSVYSPLYDFRLIPDGPTRDNDQDLLDWPSEYSGTSSSSRYGWSSVKPSWRNKAEPTDPWDPDTDEDGIKDGHEGGYGISGVGPVVAANFMYNSTGTSGGGLNPLSMDTDGDGLPDPWELEFHGTYKPGSATTQTAQATTIGADGTTNTTATTTTTYTGCTWNMDGMNATVADAHVDYDHDGLANWQEYMVGTMRCWRYDDPESTWGMQHASEDELKAILAMGPGSDEWNRYWGERLVDKESAKYNPNFANGYFDAGAAYFSCCRKPFDPANGNWYYLYDGIFHEQATDMTWFQKAFAEWGADRPYDQFAPLRYICCDPRNADTDYDGMDDYYELFHGMNPLLGMPAEGDNGRQPCDIVYDAYNGPFFGPKVQDANGVSALNNWWCNAKMPHETGMATGIKNEKVGGYDFVAYPWLNGIASADPDGDNIVNQEEAIMPNVQAASTYHHTDPTPLWMTDSSYTNSLTRRYYRVSAPQGENNLTTWAHTFAEEPTFEWEGVTYKLADFSGFTYDEDAGRLSFEYILDTSFGSYAWYYSFEENEGYDSDHDYLSDYEEGQGKTKSASDPQNHDDPLRRQAMYFNGVDAFLETPVATREWDPDPSDSSTEQRQNFLYFTVECWAKPDEESLQNDNGLRTLVERAIWADNASAADEELMRKNFLIGIKNGRWYACFDSSGTDIQPVEITDGPVATTDWAHVAATFDGTALRLYVNGGCNNIKTTSIQPEHGVAALALDQAGEMNPSGGTLGHATDEHDENFVAILVGASALNKNGIVFDWAWRYRNYQYVDETNPEGLCLTNETTFADYGNFYKGYIDEVRIWDGARSAADIQADVDNRVRYTAELAIENRQAVYNSWKEGGLRSPASEIQLPPQLMYHWSFDQIAGAISPEDVIKVPAGFDTAKNVLNAKARWSRPVDYVERNWNSTAVRSTVYTDNAWVPWINNTVAHLPRFDLTTLDSIYWSEDYAGAVAAVTNGYTSFKFPRNAEVYSRWTQRTYGSANTFYCIYLDPDFHFLNGVDGVHGVSYAFSCALTDQRSRWDVVSGYGSAHLSPPTKELAATRTDLAMTLRFALRDRNTCGDDLLPMGGVYPRRISITEGGLWDHTRGEDAEASDAWAQTGNDADNNGLPDWWEEYARANYCEDLPPWEPLEWGTTVTYRNGDKMPAHEAYFRDLASGLVKDGSTIKRDPAYADTRDTDNDGVPDWWEQIHGINASANKSEDVDGDGLSNCAEYLISEVFQFAKLDPNNPKTDGTCVDYFRKYGELYFGEMFTDHDQVGDQWEQAYATYANRYVYDPDDFGNGEGTGDADRDGWSNYAEFKAGTHPGKIQSVGIDGEVLPEYPIPAISAKVVYRGTQKLAAPIVFQAWSEKTDPGMTGTPDAAWRAADDANGTNVTKYVGLNPGTVRSYHLGTGEVSPGSVRIDFRDMAFEKTILTANGEEVPGAAYPGEVGDARWFYFVQDRNGELYTSIVSNTVAAVPVKVGTIDYATGLLTVDFGNAALQGTVYDIAVNGDTTTESESKISGTYSNCDKLNLGRSYVKIGWLPVKTDTSGNATYYLSDCTAAVVNKGHVREGKNKFVVFSDTDGSGTYTPGEPFGFVGGVTVGWQGGAFEVELTETSPIFARVDLTSTAGKATDREAFQIDNSSVMDVTEKTTLLDDLKVKVYGEDAVAAEVGEGDTATGAKTLRVRVVRALVDGKNVLGRDSDGNNVYVDRAVVMDKRLDLGVRGYIHEGDFLSEDSFDIDWATLQDQVYARDDDVGYYIDATNITYMIVMGEGDIVSGPSNLVFRSFVTRRYDSVAARQGGYLKPVIDPKQPGYVYGAKPVFRWAMQDKNGIADNSYTSFKLQVCKGATVVYDSGYRMAPARGADGWYEWTLADPLGSIVKAGDNYTWRVAMFNSKFRDDTFWNGKNQAWVAYNGGESPTVETWSESGKLVVDMNQTQEMNDHGYSSIAATVKYTGPEAVLKKGKVLLQAFTTADFAGEPVGETVVTDAAEIADTSLVTENARILGLPATGTYYLRAFIDTNGNGVKDDWESWGAAKEPVAIATADVTCPTAGIYIEDADTDGDWIPDAYEYVKYGNLTTLGPEIIGGDKICFIGTIDTSVGTPVLLKRLPGVSLTIFQNKSFVKMAMPELGAVVSIDDIRKALEGKVNPKSVKITALSLSSDRKTATLDVAADVTDTFASSLLGKVYDIADLADDTAHVTIHVYRKPSLASAEWVEVGTGFPASVGRNDVQVDVDVSGIDMTSGFYKIEITQP